MLTLKQIAEEAGVHYSTVQDWIRRRTPSRPSLPVVRFGHRTVRVRPADWERFKRRLEDRIAM